MVRPAAEAVLTRWPSPRSSISGSSARAAQMWAMTLIRQQASQPWSSASGPPEGPGIPAFDQKRSIGPLAALASAIRPLTPSSLPTSAAIAVAPISAATAEAASPSRSETTTAPAPSSAKRRARALPIPPAAPVITTCRPSISIG